MVYPTYSIRIPSVPDTPIPINLQWKVETQGASSESIVLQLEVTYLDLKIWRRTLKITVQSTPQRSLEIS
jgi:hypothetical protein